MTEVSPPLDDATRLAVERTNLALERTTMAWVRTSVSLIAFGFTIFTFFEYRHEGRHNAGISPWIMGMIMISSGLVALILALIQHLRASKDLHAQLPTLPFSLAGILAGFIILLGVVALLFVGLRL